jgi:hypothetical protein
LKKCERLLVFCSRNAATSEWVNREVQLFLKGGHRPEDVWLIVTEGSRPREEPQSVFPPAVREAGLHTKPFYDFRYFRRRAKNFREAEDELIRLAADLNGRGAA